MYVDDLMTGRESIKEVKKLKSDSITLFQQGGLSCIRGIPTKQYYKPTTHVILLN